MERTLAPGRTLSLGLATAMILALPLPADAQLGVILGTKNFEEDVLLSFDGLTPGSILLPGDPIALGVTFGGTGQPNRERAQVVETGGGNLALEQVLVSAPSVLPSTIAFTFAQPVRDVGAVITPTVDGVGNPGVIAYDALGADISAFGAWADTVGESGFFGFSGGVTPETAVRTIEFGPPSGVEGSMRFRIDDLAFAPGPDGMACAAIVALAAMGVRASRSRRRR